MAKKKPELDNVFKSTEAKAQGAAVPTGRVEVPMTGRTNSLGISIKDSELELINGIAADLNISRNSLLRYAIRKFLVEYVNDEIDLSADISAPPPARNTLELP